MNMFSLKGPSGDKITRIWPIIEVFFDDTPLEYRMDYFIEVEAIVPSLINSMIGDAISIFSYGLDDHLHIHGTPLPSPSIGYRRYITFQEE